jgi:hypothetical protein
MRLFLYILIIPILSLITSCSNDNGNIIDPPVSEYQLVHTVEKNNVKFGIYSASSNRLIYGYNFVNGVEKNSGFVKFNAIMYHGLGGPSHSTPSDDRFVYDNNKKLFKGYISFIMIDTSAFWAGYFNYNNEASVDSAIINITGSENQITLWDNQNTQKFYVLSLIKTNNPKVGLNDYHMLLHESPDMNSYTEIDNAEMFIKPWMESMGHGSPNNINPVSVGNGRYEGKVNFTMAGEWYVYDSVRVNNTWLTKTPAPKFIFNVN